MTGTPNTHQDDLARLAAGLETGFWDDQGRPAPWPDDLDEWSPTSSEPLTPEPDQQPF
jgi:hypothetical protein